MGTFKNLNGRWLIYLAEMDQRQAFNEDAFLPIDLTTEQITELVEEVLTEKV